MTDDEINLFMDELVQMMLDRTKSPTAIFSITAGLYLRTTRSFQIPDDQAMAIFADFADGNPENMGERLN